MANDRAILVDPFLAGLGIDGDQGVGGGGAEAAGGFELRLRLRLPLPLLLLLLLLLLVLLRKGPEQVGQLPHPTTASRCASVSLAQLVVRSFYLSLALALPVSPSNFSLFPIH